MGCRHIGEGKVASVLIIQSKTRVFAWGSKRKLNILAIDLVGLVSVR